MIEFPSILKFNILLSVSFLFNLRGLAMNEYPLK